MDRLLTGVGNECDSCTAPRSLWSNPAAIDAGFSMDRSFVNVQETWDSLEKNKEGEVIKRKADYEKRQGMCHRPQNVRPTLSFTITHKDCSFICWSIRKWVNLIGNIHGQLWVEDHTGH